MAIYEDQTAPLITMYAARGFLIMVDGLGEIDEVTSRIVEALNAKNQS
jgi:adenylate kinase